MTSDLNTGLKPFQDYFCYHFNINGKDACIDTKMRNRFDLRNAFKTTNLEGSSISYMSEELYQKIVSTISGGTSTYNIGYDVFLKNTMYLRQITSLDYTYLLLQKVSLKVWRLLNGNALKHILLPMLKAMSIKQ